ncbi:nascent polypeptide-associated complex subunit alpha, putative [Entamoeba invadens IP1]|uniref:Nascent polypeptide-associated complex subunit alpha, putative n=1 Tax=Entamoeba invadens IP1 TaxID=370355 RepID=A0A0A1UGQ3_ENTIV|nr:nascent polypeptide-associated complex subunit alpha, putative [Entamoeba invadens IP1]ELP92923.1 nascent polypeptide-associated complex subunit alpha, putative [Entamoeba invadens IP1]|eukprot:XP_004259694.1 nascent polypeptide-associated complex subunit alpha, putative [Entamoeba invadens IP1]
MSAEVPKVEVAAEVPKVEEKHECECHDEKCECHEEKCECHDEKCECHEHHEEEEEQKAERVQSKGEKKARKALEKIGLVEVPHVIEFSLKRQGTKFVIHEPAVFKLPGAEQFVIYGEPKNEFMDAKTRQLFEQLQANMKEQQAATGETKEEKPVAEAKEAEKPAATEADDGYVPNEEDVKVLMTQANTTHEKAYAALKKTKGDLVNAFFEFQ